MDREIEIFKALSEETRLRIVYLLASSKKELCCCELTDSLEEPLYNISRHLKILKQAGLIKERKEGRWVYSHLTPAKDNFLEFIFTAIESIPVKKLIKDKKNLKARLRIRVNDKCVRGIQKTYLIGPKEASK